MRNKLPLAALPVLLCLGAQASAPATGTQKLIAGIVGREPLRSSIVGVLAVRMNGDTLACLNSDARMVPASNMKLITTGCALRRLGSDFRFETTLAYTGTLSNGVLKGDLIIIGGGDPTTGSRCDCAESPDALFAGWREMLLDAGIVSIEGTVVADQNYFDSRSEPLTVSYEDIGTDYGASPSGLNFFENVQMLKVAPGACAGAPVNVFPSYPDTPWMVYSNLASTGRAGTGDSIVLINSHFGPFAEFRGSYPEGAYRKTAFCSNRFGAFTLAYYFHHYLNAHGIRVSGGYGDITASGMIRTDLHSDYRRPAAKLSEYTVIGVSESPTMSEIVRETNVQSNNFFAEAIFKMLGKRVCGSSLADSCSLAICSVLRSMGLNPESVQIKDGSGLSRTNYVSPSFFVRYLRAMARGPVYDEFLHSLPFPGGKGTLQGRMYGVPDAVKERVRMKSGSMNGILCYSGYLLSEDGNPERTVVFSIMTNNAVVPYRVIARLTDGIILGLAKEN